jgi:hypothetical protein
MMSRPYCGFMPEEVFVRPQFFQPSDPISELLIRSVHYRTLFAKNHQTDIFDTGGKLREFISRPGGATEISRWWSEAKPPGQVIEYCSRPGRDAGFALIGKSALVLRPFRARLAPGALPVVALRSTTG